MAKRKKTKASIKEEMSRKSLGLNQIIGQNERRFSQPVYDGDLTRIANDLIGLKVMVEAPVTKGVYDNRAGIISKVYPYHCMVKYHAGEITFKTSMSLADLYTSGVINFNSGYPEVNK